MLNKCWNKSKYVLHWMWSVGWIEARKGSNNQCKALAALTIIYMYISTALYRPSEGAFQTNLHKTVVIEPSQGLTETKEN